MTTRNIAPREQNEGSIGTQAKPWGDGYFEQMHITDDLTVADTVSTANLNVTGTATAVTPASTDNSTKVATTAFVKAFQRADGWNAETLYEAGNTVRTATLPSQYLLRCTASGTSGTTEPDCTGLSLGDTINEGDAGGTTVWVVDSYLTTSGGTMRGAITTTKATIRNGGGDALVNSNDTSWTRMNGGSGSASGASLLLYGKSSSAPGRFVLRAFDGNAANDKQLVGNINGTLLWAGNNVATTNITVNLTGNQTIAGTKTFSSSPVAPTPATSDNSTKVATTAFVRGCVPKSTGNSTTPVYVNSNGVVVPGEKYVPAANVGTIVEETGIAVPLLPNSTGSYCGTWLDPDSVWVVTAHIKFDEVFVGKRYGIELSTTAGRFNTADDSCVMSTSSGTGALSLHTSRIFKVGSSGTVVLLNAHHTSDNFCEVSGLRVRAVRIK